MEIFFTLRLRLWVIERVSAILIILFLLFCGISNCQADEPPPPPVDNSVSTQELPTATPVLDLKKGGITPGL